MSSTEEARDPTANDEIRAAYRQLVRARQQYRRATGTGFERNVHEAYHDAVFDAYDELRPRLKRRDATNELWEETKLWPTEPIYQKAALCPECTAYAPLEDDNASSPGDLCPNCGNAVLETETVPKTDENGEVEYHHVEGLESLDRYRNRVVQRYVSYTDAMGTHERTRTEQKLLAPQRLEIVADHLAEAMEVLGLYPDAKMSRGFETDEIR